MARKPLNPRQLEVLKWIAAECPEGVMAGETHKLSAVVLKNRRLVKVTKRDGWRAEMMPDGLHYLEHGEYPDEPRPSRTPSARRVRDPAAASGKPRSVGPLDARQPTNEAEGSAPGPEPAPARVEVASELPRVPVPVQLRHPHSVVLSLQGEKQHFGVVGAARHRALRIAQGLIAAAEGEGYSVRPIASTRNGYGYVSWDSLDHFTIDTGECKVGVRFLQEKDRSPHVPTERELADQKRSSWPRNLPKYDHSLSERLRIDIGRLWGSETGRRHTWGDGKRAPLEDRLPQILAEVASRHAEARERRVEHERKENDYQRQWQVEVEKAKVLLRESNRAVVLQQQAVDWRRAKDLREYVEAMGAAVERIDDPDQQAEGLAWLQWAREYPDHIDPLLRRIGVPPDPEPTDEALEPFLPQRPRRDWRWW